MSNITATISPEIKHEAYPISWYAAALNVFHVSSLKLIEQKRGLQRDIYAIHHVNHSVN